MPLTPVTLLDMSQPTRGLHIQGAPYHTPAGFLRQATAIHHTNAGALRSRSGRTLLYSIPNAHSLTRFDDARFIGAGTTLYRNGLSLLTGLNGNRLSFTRMPPTTGNIDYLFLANGGTLHKVDTSGTVTLWGIEPPTTAFTTSFGLSTKSIDGFNDFTTWTAVDCVLADEATIALFVNSMKVTITPGDIAMFTKNITIDLSQFAAGTPPTSPDEDWIELWVRTEDPSSIERIELSFSLGNTTFGSNVYTRAVQVQQVLEPFLQQSDVQRHGISDFEDSFFNQRRIVARDYLATPQDRIRLQEFVAQAALPATRHTWVQLRLPKSSFTRQGSSASLTWADVQSVRFTIITNNQGSDDIILYLDTMQLHGRVGHQGDYEYYSTFFNSTTGTRSNPSPVTRYARAAREVITFNAVPTSPDTQVNRRELWSTIGNGTIPFRIGTINDNTTTTFVNNVSDFQGLDSSGAYPYMENLELPLDNVRVFDTFRDVLYDAGVTFWLDSASGRKGRVYYSPADRHEVTAGHIDVTDDDDPLMKLVTYNGIRYVFAEGGVYRIEGLQAYRTRKVENIPGVMDAQRFTVTRVPEGILWQANDGIRLFDGARTELIADERIGTLFRGETHEGIPPFEGTCATYARNEYLISDGTTTLAFNRSTGQIRSLGFGCSALYYEDDTDTLLAALSDGVYAIEEEDITTDNGTAITCAITTPAIALEEQWGSYVHRVYIKANTHGAQCFPTLTLGNASLPLPPFISTSDEDVLEYPIGRTAPWARIALQGTAPLEIFKIWLDIYNP